ncbi:MAG: M23 family metallopeptidase, partial [Candidatus Firestonebacteria bacterium]|nr:M23 family metallopeptidase [Candidatus Firestonebacteria bacterium]
VGQKLKIPVNMEDLSYIGERFIWPVRGRVITGFGMRNNIPHKGIDIQASPGTLVKASRKGEIKYTGYFPQLKNVIIIKHDDVTSTVYSNIDEVKVTIGTKVEEGEDIGTVAIKNDSKNSFLHFETRFNIIAKNPLYYLEK